MTGTSIINILLHVDMKTLDVVVRRSDMFIGSDDIIGRSRPKLTLEAIVKSDIIGLNLNEHLTTDRIQ